MNSSPSCVPAGWDRDGCVLWEGNHCTEALAKTLSSIEKTRNEDPRLSIQAAYYLFLMNDHMNAAVVLEKQLKVTPEHFDSILNLAVCYGRLSRWEDAVKLSRRILDLEPSNFTALDLLAMCLFQLKDHAGSSEAGTRVLELKDSACADSDAPEWALPESRPKDFAAQSGKRNVIAYSLWGAQANYLRGALRNLLLAPDMYPGWTLRFYLDSSVPREFVRLIIKLGGEVFIQPENQSLRQKLCWRFKVANDANVGYFLVRDVDSVIGVREVQAVQAWIASTEWFHVMRDWWTHTDLILAGMWGGVAGVLPNLDSMLREYLPAVAETPNIDQWFLRDKVWPYVRNSCLVHDRCFHPKGALPFPSPALAGDLHIGQDEYAARRALQERFLRPWIISHTCLGEIDLA